MDVIHPKEELHTSSDYDQDAKSPANDRRNNADENDDNWILQIKMVGNEINQSDFHISLHPNDDIIQLYHQITNKTDIPYHQQRLIYRGRLLPHIRDTATTTTTAATSSKNVYSTATEDVSLLQHHTTEDDVTPLSDDYFSKKVAARTNDTMVSRHLFLNQKVRDIVGLMNGHAIHLVVRQNDIQAATGTSSTTDEGEEENEEGFTATITSDPASTASSSSSSSSGSTSLLAALLGMSGGSGSNERSTGATSSSSTGHPRRHHTYRLTEEDWIRPDPGPLETVRQGLMTFHTLQQFNHSTTAPPSNNDSMTYPHQQLPNRRHFYLGQWIDCRDTVNQWLEATVVSILYPRDIMHLYHHNTITPTDSTSADASLSFQPTTDPPIAVTDFDGRRRLLLEPCTESESEECIDGEHYRRRANNEHVQILHIHYNGWPVRWDEWIRSDSERIRVFRTRTRHHSTSVDQQSQRHYASPNIDSVMPDAPYTYITNSEQNDRSALLPELHRAIQTLQDRLATASSSSSAMTTAHLNAIRTSSTSRMNHLPWNADETPSLNATASTTTSLANLDGETHQEEQRMQSRRSQVAISRQKQRQELEALAPLLDRLGRVLIDAAPQVLALADTIGQEDDDDEDIEENHLENFLGDTDDAEPHETPPATNTLGGLLSLLNRDRRGGGRGSVASGSNVALPSVVSDVEISTVASSSTTTTDLVVQPTEPSRSTSLGATNILDPDDDADDIDEEEICDGNGGTTEYTDPDYRDFAAGLVNTSRGDVRSTNGGGSNSIFSSRRASSSDDGTTSLLGAYLAAMSMGGIASISAGDRDDGDGGTGVAEGLGRFFRDRGSGSGGIDIHIHAVVTAPGLDGAIGFAALTGGGGAVTLPVATPVTGQATTTNGTNGALDSFEGSTARRRAGSRRFRSMSATTPDTTVDDHLLVGETTIIEEEDLDLFADLYSETPDPINPNNPTYQVPAITALNDPNEDNLEYQENPTQFSSTFRQNRSRSLRRIHVIHSSSSGDNSGEQYQTNTHRIHRNEPRNISNEQRNSSNGNNNLLRRIFRRPDGGH